MEAWPTYRSVQDVQVSAQSPGSDLGQLSGIPLTFGGSKFSGESLVAMLSNAIRFELSFSLIS